MPEHGRDYAMAGESGHSSSAHVKPCVFVAAVLGGGRSHVAAFRRAVVGFAGAALVVAAVVAAATVDRPGQGATLRIVLKDEGDPSDVAAQIIASAKGFNREVDDLVPHDDPASPPDTRLEQNYPQLAESIVKHGSGILYRLIHGAPVEPMEGIPMPVDDEDPPDADGMDEGGEPPQTTPQPDPSADQGALAESIIQDSNKAREQNLMQANTSGAVKPVAPSSVRVMWPNNGAEAESNALDYSEEPAHKDPDDPSRPLMGTAWAKGGRNYWRVNDAGENIDTIMKDGAMVQQLGALGGGYAQSTTEGLGPAISESQDNGALAADHFTIDSTQVRVCWCVCVYVHVIHISYPTHPLQPMTLTTSLTTPLSPRLSPCTSLLGPPSPHAG